jgi:hypothetical protein
MCLDYKNSYSVINDYTDQIKKNLLYISNNYSSDEVNFYKSLSLKNITISDNEIKDNYKKYLLMPLFNSINMEELYTHKNRFYEY